MPLAIGYPQSCCAALPDVDDWQAERMPATAVLSAMENWTRLQARGLDAEIALVWPVLGERVHILGAPTVLSVGDRSAVRLRPKDVFGAVLRVNADAVVIAHTHLTDRGPSADDRAVTRRLVAAGVVLGIPLLAHLVVQPGGTQELVGVAASVSNCDVVRGIAS